MKIHPFHALAEVSPVIRLLTASDIILGAGIGLFGPIFAILIANKINTNNPLEVISIGTSIYLFTQSVGLMPLGILIDKIKGEHDDFWILFAGSLVYVLVPLLYLLITEPWHLFVIQFIYGVGTAMTLPTWTAIFSRHIDTGKEGIEWSLWQSSTNLSCAIAAPVGGFIASYYGFNAIMYLASAMASLSCLYIFLIRKSLYKR